MKVLKYIQMATIVAALGFVSCNNDDIPQIGDGELKIIATIGDPKSRVNTEEDGSKFLPGEILMIYNGEGYEYITEKGTVNGTAEFKAVSDKVYWKKTQMMFGASNKKWDSVECDYWNGKESNCFRGSTLIASDQTTVEKLRLVDIIVGYSLNQYDYNATNGVVSFNMMHALSKVTVSIKEYNGIDNPVKDGYKINNMKIFSKANPGSHIYFYFNEGRWEWSESSPSNEKVAISPLMKEDKTNGKHSFTAIIAPKSYATGDVFLSFEFQGFEYTVLANSDLCSEGFLQPGKHYHFDLTINTKASVNISKVSLIDWEEGVEHTEYATLNPYL